MTGGPANATAAPMGRDIFKSPLKSAWVQECLGDLAGACLHGTSVATRWTVDAAPLLDTLAAGKPCITVFWHECLPSMPTMWLAARQRRPDMSGYVLASRHRDGQLVARAMGYFGMKTVSGSTSRGGAAGLRELARLIGDGHPVALTPDGPRGPRRRAAPGVAQLAGLTGAPVFCAAAATSRAITLGSWDSMRFPLPFGRGALLAGEPILVPRQDWETALPAIEAGMTAQLTKAMDLCR